MLNFCHIFIQSYTSNYEKPFLKTIFKYKINNIIFSVPKTSSSIQLFRRVHICLQINLPCLNIAGNILLVQQSDFYGCICKPSTSNPTAIVGKHFHGININEHPDIFGIDATNNQIACLLPVQRLLKICNLKKY